MPIQILMFHGVCAAGDNVQENHKSIHISESRFRSFLKNLNMYANVISMDDVVDHIQKKAPFPPNCFAITFDDGFKNNYEVAAKHLREVGLPATFYISTNLIGSSELYMNWTEVKEMYRDPLFIVGGHSHDHVNLAELSKPELSRQIKLCTEKLIIHGIEPRHFAYPYGQLRHINSFVISQLQSAGFVCSPTAQIGLNDHKSSLFALKRISIT